MKILFHHSQDHGAPTARADCSLATKCSRECGNSVEFKWQRIKRDRKLHPRADLLCLRAKFRQTKPIYTVCCYYNATGKNINKSGHVFKEYIFRSVSLSAINFQFILLLPTLK